MIEYTLNPANAILHLQPKSSLDQADFEKLTKAVDPFIEKNGDLAGVIVETPAFPGWSSFGAFAAHMRFVKDHHRRIRKIALVTDSPIGDVAEHLVSHFVSAEVKQFPASGVESARNWILNRS